MNHLRYAHLPEPDLRDVLLSVIRETEFLTQSIARAQEQGLADWRIVSGALYNVIWNHLTDRPATYGIKDIDLMYFDPDTSWEAEDTVIQSATGFPKTPPIEIRNQARVHIWYKQHFGQTILPLTSVNEAIDLFASQTHSVGIRMDATGHLDLYAPYGLHDIFTMNIVPNYRRPNKETHMAKAARAKQCWPEITIVPW